MTSSDSEASQPLNVDFRLTWVAPAAGYKKLRPLRGGPWTDSPRYCRSAQRPPLGVGSAYSFIGVRLACLEPATGEEGCRLLRGGSWYDDPRDCRSAYRGHYEPDDAINDVGFRVACLP